MRRSGERTNLSHYKTVLECFVDRTAARYAAWYEVFPRSMSDDVNRHGNFDDVIAKLPYVRDMGFDVLYFTPIHPIGKSFRKGKNNTLDAKEDDVARQGRRGSGDTAAAFQRSAYRHAPVGRASTNLSHYKTVLECFVDRTAARYAAWYEVFPRSMSDDVNRHGTFDDVHPQAALCPRHGLRRAVLHADPPHRASPSARARTTRSTPRKTMSAAPTPSARPRAAMTRFIPNSAPSRTSPGW